MKPSAAVYDNPRLAAGYAFDRPPVHQEILRTVPPQFARRFARALDIGCGAGVSTAALDPLARALVGIDPSTNMLAHHRDVCPAGAFAVGRAEALPFAAGAFDLAAAAGSINYTEIAACLAEVGRVLSGSGILLIYDFSDGRRVRNDRRLEDWYEEFERRYPPQAGYALDVTLLPYADAGLRLGRYDELLVAVPMSATSYVRYAMSQTPVGAAIAAGTPEDAIRRWCSDTLAEIFASGPQDVMFEAYLARIERAAAHPPP